MDTLFLRMAANTHIVLVRTQGGLNLGSAARAMANFEFASLRLVTPECDILGVEARSMAMDALPLIESAQIFETLPAAIADCATVFGTTRRVGRKRRAELAPADMAEFLKGVGPDRAAAIVFGNEGKGLSNEELECCNAIVTVRTRADFNSFNLAQAVLLMLYETHRAFQDTPAAAATRIERLDELMGHTETLLRRARIVTGADTMQVMTRLRKILLRADITFRESRMLHTIIAHLDKALDRTLPDPPDFPRLKM